MSTAVYPTNTQLPGVTYTVKRTPQVQSRIQISISGKETRISDWSYPRYNYELQYEFLRTAAAFQELQRLGAFYVARLGPFDSFLFNDVDDNGVTGQVIGTGDGVATSFQLVRTYGPSGTVAVEPIFAPNVVSAVKVNGVLQTVDVDYGVGNWENGVTPNGTLAFFSGAPADGAVITADFTFYWPCRFSDDTLDLEKFMNGLWQAKSVKFMSLK
jgi:uncharacterized protein (TIGR02217 family)